MTIITLYSGSGLGQACFDEVKKLTGSKQEKLANAQDDTTRRSIIILNRFEHKESIDNRKRHQSTSVLMPMLFTANFL